MVFVNIVVLLLWVTGRTVTVRSHLARIDARHKSSSGLGTMTARISREIWKCFSNQSFAHVPADNSLPDDPGRKVCPGRAREQFSASCSSLLEHLAYTSRHIL
jgi:hypothetical protein